MKDVKVKILESTNYKGRVVRLNDVIDCDYFTAVYLRENRKCLIVEDETKTLEKETEEVKETKEVKKKSK